MVLYADAHMHTSPQGLGALEVGKRFRSAGGWFAALVMLPPWHYLDEFKPSLEYYEKALKVFLSECEKLRSTGLRVVCLAGFHPAEVDKLVSRGLTPEQVLELAEAVLRLEEELCRKGVLQGIGEIGRQHYKTSPERFAIAETIMIRALEIARDNDCIVHLHLENAGPATARTVDRIVRLVKIDRRRILFHHASVRVAREATMLGYTATIPGKLEALRRAFSELSPGFMVESDYIDDPHRPCVSVCPWDMVRFQGELLERGEVDEELLVKVNIDNIVEFYRVEPP
ncbi:TatD family hydrolase [Hyperthermus butylicus]|uniref:Conserved archaeal protein n=1 Tax=Hyperthermus butylicus (strain DSM 5456 / JCM 9403 / PLM1-5) TaxID=415426 RepID=A2BM84_HYPBU|nr:TatD family hydrolase [Hyperthermus butylicus]ABM81095.1 conserved archaeal protein [Hyperthermus butylicus DSM 5456]